MSDFNTGYIGIIFLVVSGIEYLKGNEYGSYGFLITSFIFFTFQVIIYFGSQKKGGQNGKNK